MENKRNPKQRIMKRTKFLVLAVAMVCGVVAF